MVAITRICRYEICRNSAIRKAAAPSVGGESSAPMPCSRQHRARGLGAVACPPQQRPRHRSQHDRRRHAAARHGAEEESGDGHRPAGSGHRPAAGLQRPFDEEEAGAARVQQRTVDREEDDVGGGDVERHSENALERHVERADQSRRTVATMCDQVEADPVEQRAGPRVQQECEWRSPAAPSRPRGASLRAPARWRWPRESDRCWSARPRGRRTAGNRSAAS